MVVSDLAGLPAAGRLVCSPSEVSNLDTVLAQRVACSASTRGDCDFVTSFDVILRLSASITLGSRLCVDRKASSRLSWTARATVRPDLLADSPFGHGFPRIRCSCVGGSVCCIFDASYWTCVGHDTLGVTRNHDTRWCFRVHACPTYRLDRADEHKIASEETMQLEKQAAQKATQKALPTRRQAEDLHIPRERSYTERAKRGFGNTRSIVTEAIEFIVHR